MIRCRFKWCNAFIKFLILLHNNERNIFHTDQHIFSFKNRVHVSNVIYYTRYLYQSICTSHDNWSEKITLCPIRENCKKNSRVDLMRILSSLVAPEVVNRLQCHQWRQSWQYDNSGVSVRVHKGYGDAGSTRVSFSTWVSKCHGDMLKKICRKRVSHIIFVSPAGVKCHQRGDPGQVWNGWFIVCQSTYDLDWKQHHVKSPRSNDLLYKTIARQDV